MKTLVTIATYKRSRTAYFLKQQLEAENIDCFFVLAGTIDGKMEEVKVQVKELDVERAIRVMLHIKDEYGKEIEEIEHTRHIRKIIVPTDFSKGSEDASYYAVHLAQKLNAEIKLLHVYANPIEDVNLKSSASFEHYTFHVLKDEEKRAKSDMVDFSNKIKEYMDAQKITNVKVHSSIVMGNIIRRMKALCKIYQPDLIVLGTAGKRDKSQSVFTGVANELVMGLGIPVYAIPGARPAYDFEQVNILYATDFNDKDNTSLNRLLQIMEPFEKQITCVHIDTAHNPAKEDRIDELNDFLRKEYGQHKIQCRLIEYADVYHGIKDFADSNNMNLLSFTIHKRGIFEKLFMPNLFKKILQEANLPILIFPS